ncbi:MAG: hypothetical protein IJX98_06340 [Clostridia bacterium]|nr:hypothetical protein [Clostridia bacterium]
MRTAIFQKWIFRVIALVCLLVVGAGFTLAIWLSGSQSAAGYSFYFLVYQTDSLQASQSDIRLQGGAGYLMDTGVAFSVYFEESTAESVRNRIVKDYPTATVKCLKTGNFRLCGSEQRDRIIGEYTSFYGVLKSLERTVELLENGQTQNKIKNLLHDLCDWLDYFSRESEVELGKVVQVLSNGLKEAMEGVVYADALRYSLCEACEGLAASAVRFNF